MGAFERICGSERGLWKLAARLYKAFFKWVCAVFNSGARAGFWVFYMKKCRSHYLEFPVLVPLLPLATAVGTVMSPSSSYQQ